jgi:DNA-binding beta-propeller fold protein YncE
VSTYTADGLSHPKDLDFGPDGRIYVADYDNQRIAILSASGEYLDSYGERAFPGRGGPDGIAVDPVTNRIYVADGSTRVVWIFPLNSDTLAPQRIDIPEFDDPIDVAVAADGSLYVADNTAHKVFHLTSSGALIGELGGDFGGPTRSVSIAPDGRIYVVAGQYVATPTGHYEHEVWVFAPDGTLIDRLGRALLTDTSGVIAAGNAGDVFVTEQALGHVYRFRAP